MNTYECKVAPAWDNERWTAPPRPIERVRAVNSFDARREYATRHGLDTLQCIAIRIRED